MRRGLLAVGLAALFAVAACGGARKSGICGDINPAPTAQGDAAALNAEAEAAWLQRLEIDQLNKAIDTWEESLKVKPMQPDVRAKLSRAHYFLADTHYRLADETDKMLAHFKAGTNHGELSLAQAYPKFRTKHCARAPFKEVIQTLDKDAVPAMYWFATNLGKYGLASSIVMVLNEKDRIFAIMALVKKLQPDFFHYAADRYFGVYWTKIPFPDGDLPKARSHFESSISGAPYYTGTKVLFAEYHALKAKEKALFKRLLEETIAHDVKSSHPDLEPENLMEKKKAKNLLDELDVYFPEG